MVSAACDEFCIPPGTLGLCLYRAKTLPAHRQMLFTACEMENMSSSYGILGSLLSLSVYLEQSTIPSTKYVFLVPLCRLLPPPRHRTRTAFRRNELPQSVPWPQRMLHVHCRCQPLGEMAVADPPGSHHRQCCRLGAQLFKTRSFNVAAWQIELRQCAVTGQRLGATSQPQLDNSLLGHCTDR